MDARGVTDALRSRYGGDDRWTCIEEARSGAGFNGNNGRCDFLAVNTWQARGMEVIGHEIKVSRSDWNAELAQPEKAERFARYCRRWFVVAPAVLAKAIKDEVPPAWGLLSVSDNGAVRQIVAAPARRDAEPVPAWWWVGWLAQIDRQTKRSIPRMVDRAMADERAEVQARINIAVQATRDQDAAGSERLRRAAGLLKDATGIDLLYAYAHDLETLGSLWRASRSGINLQGLATNLRRTAESLDAVAAATVPE